MANKETTEKITFEEALEKLDDCVGKLGKERGTTEESMKAYEDGINYYKICKDILDGAEQRIIEIGKNEDEIDE